MEIVKARSWYSLLNEITRCYPEPFRPFKDGLYGYVLEDGRTLHEISVKSLEARGFVKVSGTWRTRDFLIELTEAGVRAAVRSQCPGIIDFLLSHLES